MSAALRLIGRLTAVFGEPRSSNRDLFLAEFERAIAGYADDVLDRAGSEVIANSTFWPKPAEIREAARRIAAAMSAARLPRNEPEPEPPTPESVARCKALVAELKRSVSERAVPPPATPRPFVVSRDAFRAMQIWSENDHLHKPRRGLTPTSRAMSGERDDA